MLVHWKFPVSSTTNDSLIKPLKILQSEHLTGLKTTNCDDIRQRRPTDKVLKAILIKYIFNFEFAIAPASYVSHVS